jgi:hypothetical protein
VENPLKPCALAFVAALELGGELKLKKVQMLTAPNKK